MSYPCSGKPYSLDDIDKTKNLHNKLSEPANVVLPFKGTKINYDLFSSLPNEYKKFHKNQWSRFERVL